MYETFYQFKRLPFENTPDPKFFFETEQYREALAAVEYVVRMRKGFVLVTGDAGTGKTTVGRTMCQRCEDATVVHVLPGHTDRSHLFRQILQSLDLDVKRDDDRASMISRLRQHLIAQSEKDRTVILLVDEAQAAPDEVLEELRLLSSLDTASQKLVQVVLLGRPELRSRIVRPQLALGDRIALAKRLGALTRGQTRAYIDHRLSVASLRPNQRKVSFNDAAIRSIYRVTRGCPRLINAACDNCLLLGFVQETRHICAEMVATIMKNSVSSIVDTASVWPNSIKVGRDVRVPAPSRITKENISDRSALSLASSALGV